MIVYRIAKGDWIHDLTGEGARRYGGRWSPRGVPLIYAAENRSLAVLNLLLQLPAPLLPEDWRIATLEVPDDGVASLNDQQYALPAGTPPPGRSWQAIGHAWLRSERSLALRVPSEVGKEEAHILINPRHPQASRVRLVDVGPVAWNAGLISG